jgi:Pyruvate/2-oxoacid:ferredoxin oxidoreductase delta subunit
MKPVINKRRCSAQKDICTALKVCSQGAMQYVEDEEEPLGGRIVIDYGLCDECGLCAAACCGQAIDMKSLEQ